MKITNKILVLLEALWHPLKIALRYGRLMPKIEKLQRAMDEQAV